MKRSFKGQQKKKKDILSESETTQSESESEARRTEEEGLFELSEGEAVSLVAGALSSEEEREAVAEPQPRKMSQWLIDFHKEKGTTEAELAEIFREHTPLSGSDVSEFMKGYTGPSRLRKIKGGEPVKLAQEVLKPSPPTPSVPIPTPPTQEELERRREALQTQMTRVGLAELATAELIQRRDALQTQMSRVQRDKEKKKR